MRSAFRTRYGRDPRLFAAPGRVNLIGEHTDYNDGFVLPVAIDRVTVVAGAHRDDRRIRVFSRNANEALECDLDAPAQRRRNSWLDYVEGVARMLEARGHRLQGADMLIESDVPEGAGLSSSAALEISVGSALAALSGVAVDPIDLALAAQQAEHEFVGTMCGIMDQFIAVLGAPSHALLIDCRALTATSVPVDTTDIDIVICDSGVKHDLASTEYNTRRSECERGVAIIGKAMPDVRALRDVSPADFEEVAGTLPEPIRARCRHVVRENARTLDAARALRAHDLQAMGKLMAASHVSLRDDYQVSCAELDQLVEIAVRCADVIGARMTGGGFGGSTVNIVRKEGCLEFVQQTTAEYYEPRGMEPRIHVARISRGAHEIS